MSHETTEVRLDHDRSPVTWYGDSAPGIAPTTRDPGGSGDTSMFDMHCFRAPCARTFLECASPPSPASRVRRRAGICGCPVACGANRSLRVDALRAAVFRLGAGGRRDRRSPRRPPHTRRAAAGTRGAGLDRGVRGRRGAGFEGRLVPGGFRAGCAAGGGAHGGLPGRTARAAGPEGGAARVRRRAHRRAAPAEGDAAQ